VNLVPGLDGYRSTYVATGLGMVATFVVFVAVLVHLTGVEPTPKTLVGFTVGFLAYVSVYFISVRLTELIPEGEN